MTNPHNPQPHSFRTNAPGTKTSISPYSRPTGAAAAEAPSSGSALRNIRFRTIRPDDWRRLQLFHQRLSESSVHLRFHGAKRALSTPLARRFTDLDGHNDVAVVATTGTWGRIVGVARYYRTGPNSAEVAFVVEDGYQGHGIGRRLMAHLVTEARKNGITEFVAEVLSGNTRMLHLLQETGPIQVRYMTGVDEVRVNLEPGANPADDAAL